VTDQMETMGLDLDYLVIKDCWERRSCSQDLVVQREGVVRRATRATHEAIIGFPYYCRADIVLALVCSLLASKESIAVHCSTLRGLVVTAE
jgi:hypothetical protein